MTDGYLAIHIALHNLPSLNLKHIVKQLVRIQLVRDYEDCFSLFEFAQGVKERGVIFPVERAGRLVEQDYRRVL